LFYPKADTAFGGLAIGECVKILENKALLLKVKDAERITKVIPKSRVMAAHPDHYEVLVHWGLEESRVLKNLNIKNVPSPILGNYKWNGLYKPFDHQKTTSAFLTLHKRGFCFNEQGTGKTGSVIWAADYLMTLGFIKRVLVICPLSIMESAWRADLFKFAMHRSVDVAYGNRDKRKTIIEGSAEFVVINFDGVEIVADDISKAKFDLIVVDEANAYKNPQTKRWKILNRLVTPETWLWMLTGTPASQSPLDAYGLAKLVSPDRVPKYMTLFRDMVLYKVSQFRWIAKPNADTVVHNALQPAIRFTKEQCLDLPEMTYVTRDIPLTPQQTKYYEIMRKEMLVSAAGEQITTINAAANLNKLLQLSGGAVYSDTGEVVQFDAGTRMSVLEEVIDEASHKVLVFVPFRHAIDIITEHLKKRYAVDTIHGGVSAGKRTQIFEKFQKEKDPRVLIIQPQAASHGVTLHAADTIVYWSPVMSVETYLQANARVHRAGQKNATTVIHLQGSPVERKLYKMLQDKVDVHLKITDMYTELLS
jgi:SNF2 family DNA or RNA helicase